ncbi:MAG: extracellular solute-binding protein [Candidatus Kariarchaeaceae archaeon]|jgi:arabinogalactan oligomer/maltooligosaccharide transport system substrate-binding protein
MKLKHTLIVLLLLITSFGSTPTTAQSTITITFWWTEGAIEGVVYDTLIANFEAANPGVEIDDRQIGYFDTESSYENALIAGTQPHVLRADVTWITKWADQGVLEPLDDYSWDQSDFFDDALRLAKWKGDTYGMPQVVDTLGIMYNVKLFEDAGITVPAGGFNFTEFAQVAESLTDRTSTNPDEWVYGYTSAHMTYHFLPIFYGHGAEYFSPNSIAQDNIALDSAGTRNAIQYLDNLIGNKFVDPLAEYKAVTPQRDQHTYQNLNDFFMNGKVAIIQQGPWELRNILDNGAMFNKEAYEELNTPDTAPDWVGPQNLGFMEVPKSVIGGETFQGMHVGGHAMIMSAKTPDNQKDMTFKFMDYLTGSEATYIRGKTNHLVSPRESFYTTDFNTSDTYVPSEDPYIAGFKLNLDNAFARPVHPYFITFDGFFGEELSSHLLEEQDIEETITKTLTKWNNYFEVYGEIADTVPTLITDTNSTTTSSEKIDKDDSPFPTWIIVPTILVAVSIRMRRQRAK